MDIKEKLNKYGLAKATEWLRALTAWARRLWTKMLPTLLWVAGKLRWLHPRRYMRILDWYIIKKFIGTYFFAILLIISISIVFDVNEQIIYQI